MASHFNFTPGLDSAEKLAEFGSYLYRSLGSEPIRELFGINLVIRNSAIRAEFDGTKYGRGAFDSEGEIITFTLGAKVDEFDPQTLLRIAAKAESQPGALRSWSQLEVRGGRDAGEGMNLPFLLGMLDEIVRARTSSFQVFNSRSRVVNRGVVRGRPDGRGLVLNLLRARSEVESFVLDNRAQLELAALVWGTARDVWRKIEEWSRVSGVEFAREQDAYRTIRSRFQRMSLPDFDQGLLRSVRQGSPPLGLERVRERCLYYWQLHGRLDLAGTGRQLRFTNVAIDLARIFESYVSAVLENQLHGYRRHPKRSYPYQVERADDRSIEPDVVFHNSDDRALVIAEVKYQREGKMARREHVSQLISYLDYEQYPWEVSKRAGLLVYPGSEFTMNRIDGFTSSIYVVTLPVAEGLVISPQPETARQPESTIGLSILQHLWPSPCNPNH